MSEILSAFGHVIDPLCGRFGFFTLFGSGLLSCGDAGWMDEIAFGVWVTASLAVATLPIGLVLGFLIALAKRAEDRYLQLSVNLYTTIFRALPELLTIFIVYYGLQIAIQSLISLLGFDETININAFAAGMAALAVVFSAYCSEVLQSAFQAIPQGQYEAGEALGLGRRKTLILIVLPQLVRIALPGLGNLWMVLLKDTALVSIVGLPDIMRQAGIAARITKEPFLFYGIACLIYLLLSLLSSGVLSRTDKWARKAEER
ncbi:ABC transporter permease [Rhizobium sp. L1K21]|uniref:ABC transporter permease n=1 Tax=Rhizobium sp. L1K21 TaxID=2954933 RepID=UPI002092CECA|nr:ABC transporter permease subunit [Rhizobium sp. L1K21]MCO6186347.1 ABC transporter permease subunit [Rhizobium sp. L1K21]